jgi:fibronectin-binding autotransporter adhesin
VNTAKFNLLRSPGILSLLLILAAAPPVLAQNSYSWYSGTNGTWSNFNNWDLVSGSGNYPGDEGSSTTDTAVLSTGTVTYDTGATGYVGTMDMVQTTSSSADYLVLNQNLTLNQGGQLYQDASKGVEQIDLENNNLTIGAGAVFEIGTTTDANEDGTNARTYITNQAVAASGATTGTGGVIVNGQLQIAVAQGVVDYAPQIIAPLSIGATGTLNLLDDSTSEDRFYVNGNFSTATGAKLESTGTESATEDIIFEGSTVTIAAGTVMSGWATSGVNFSNNAGQTVSFGTLFSTNQTMTFTFGATGSASVQNVATDLVSSSFTSGGIANAMNQIQIKNNGASHSTAIFQLGSNLNLINSGPVINQFSGLGADVGNIIEVDLNGFSYSTGTVTNNPGFNPSANQTTAGDSQIQIINSQAANVGGTALGGNGTTISGTAGIFKAGFFTLSGNDMGIGNGVVLQAVNTGTVNNLGVQASGVTTINSGSAFYYTGGSAAASDLISNRTIGSLIVGTAAGSSSTLDLSSNITAGGPVTINSGSTLDLSNTGALTGSTAGTYALTGAGLSGSGTLTNAGTSAAATTVTLNGSGTNTFTGVIADAGGANTVGLKLTSGTQTLAGANTYAGATSVSGGNLNVTGSLGASSAVTVGGFSGSGATAILSGTGTISGALATSSANSNVAHIAPGASAGVVGTLHVGSLGFSVGSGTNFDYDINTTVANSDLLSMNGGTLTIGGSGIVFNFNQLSSLTTGSAYTLISGDSAISFASGSVTSDFSATGIGSDTATFSVSGNNLVVTFSPSVTATTGTYTLTTTAGANVMHAGASTSLTTTLANTGTGTADSLNVTGLGAASTGGTINNGTVSSGTVVQTGTLQNTGQTFTASTTGSQTVTGTVTSVVGDNGTGAATQAGNTGANVFVYSGVGVWKTAGGGSWGTTATATPANWQANGGVPGITSGFATTDSASFGDTGFSGTATVTLDGASPSLNAITFNNGTGSYNITQGTSGMIHLDSTGTATITDTLGNHTISAPVELDSNASASVASSNNTLTISGNISQSGTHSFAISGPGTTILSGSNSYSGGTSLASGSLLLSNTSGSATGLGALNIAAGATLGGYGSSSGSSFSIGGAGSPTTVLVGMNSASDANTSHTLTLMGSGANSITNTTLQFNISATSLGQGNELSVGTSAITFTSSTLALNVQGAGVITANSPYVLIAGTGSNQYSGLSTQEETINGQMFDVITGGLNLSFAPSLANTWYATNSFLYLNSAGGVDDIDVEVVPEPGTWALMLGGLAVLAFWQRQRARSGRS